ncbi:hypothetical protein [Methylobacterium sp. NEAU K]|uniref:hypothetical protein n=1 Tax=Methylobacterium sp. NEAU K TaxID=3064946 RepID=UPI002734C2C9|nr:hypothetical protein [Methylobacterium sp. NEAU K]MDP4005536.1 hypothetical protein [Methylobacterium sp. NEAU K]
MGLSDDEIEARLAALRRQREALDREIADLVLYLELGRRLRGAGARPVPPDPDEHAPDRSAGPAAGPTARPTARSASGPREVPAPGPAAAPRPGPEGGASEEAAPDGIPPAIAFTEDAAGARRYGRALVEAACAAIAQAGRPLHAGEILETLLARGFTLPGRDPVAALNTRLWKRAGPGGPLRRVAEATYALAGAPDAEADRP